MANSLSIHKMDKTCSEFDDGISFSLDAQKTLNVWGDDVGAYFLPETNIKYEFKDVNYRYYSVKTSSEMFKEPINIYWDDIEQIIEYNRGYSKIKLFKFMVDLDGDFIYIFAPKKTAKHFVKRIVKEKKMLFSNVKFDFSRITELENLNAAWGIWMDSKGAIRKIAEFGKDVTTELSEEEYFLITTFYIDYLYKGNVVQLTLNVEGRISTLNNLNNQDMIFLYNEIKENLVIKN
ncbi:MAG: hypothetical protein E4G94_01210 [ANME-2 cluster archaeon]|nr:MAG: hypothetical protein E4G94_01210 [ANME-2 cluster archaeon]